MKDKSFETDSEEILPEIEASDALNFIKEYKYRNCNKITIATLIIDSLPKKFSSLKEIIDNKIDILIVQETKIDATFPQGLFVIPRCKVPFRKDHDINGGGNLMYVREDKRIERIEN